MRPPLVTFVVEVIWSWFVTCVEFAPECMFTYWGNVVYRSWQILIFGVPVARERILGFGCEKVVIELLELFLYIQPRISESKASASGYLVKLAMVVPPNTEPASHHTS